MIKVDNFDLTPLNTFRMKARCACFVEYGSSAELDSMDWDSLPKPIRHIGEGSNLLLTGDFRGTILHSGIKTIKYLDMGFDDVPVMVGSGVRWDDFVEQVCGYGLWGAENLSLIPGETGAAAVQNIGAYGVEIADIISGVTCYDMHARKRVKFSREECGYGYRDSFFKQTGGRFIVTGVLIRLSRIPRMRLEYKGLKEVFADKAPAGPMDVRRAVIDIRRSKLPDPAELGSAGSFFKNPVVSAAEFAHIIEVSKRDFGEDVHIPHFVQPDGRVKVPAAWMIEKCGLKGATQGGAAVYEKQPLVIVNASGCASAEDILTLERRIIDSVHSRFGVTLSPEVEHI